MPFTFISFYFSKGNANRLKYAAISLTPISITKLSIKKNRSFHTTQHFTNRFP